jgi:16S rRNA processing protein RimM
LRRPLFHLDNGEIDLTERFQVGVITTPHGLKGEVKVFPTTDDPGRFRVLRELILKEKKSERVLKVRSVKFFKQFVILGFEGLNRIEDVEQLRGCSLLVERKDAVPLEENEYYIADLIGLSVRKEDGTEIGTLFEVLETGANDVYVVKREGMKNLLLPAISQCILDVQPEQGFMTVHIMEGLEDL